MVKKGFKKTEIGLIPEDWEVISLGNFCEIKDGTHQTPKYVSVGIPFYSVENVTANDFENTKFISEEEHKRLTKNFRIEKDDILMTRIGSIGVCKLVDWDINASFYVSLALLKIKNKVLPKYFVQYSKLENFKKEIEINALQFAYPQKINLGEISKIRIALPPTKPEQEAIAKVLSDTDTLIEKLEQLIAKKRNIKTATMQQLLKPKEGWEVKKLGDCTNCLDNLRFPLNDSQRLSMKGDYPYCGANGILDYINDYRIDDEVILIAEDGGYFDEYATRPIAYKMKGKFWVNNHAHILKAKPEYEQDFIFYSLVHKNILTFLASGTRAKLNKSEMYKLEIDTPKDKTEQTRIAQILTDMDNEIEVLAIKLNKYKMLKQGLMQVLLTGKIRLV